MIIYLAAALFSMHERRANRAVAAALARAFRTRLPFRTDRLRLFPFGPAHGHQPWQARGSMFFFHGEVKGEVAP